MGVLIQELRIDGLKSQLNEKQINLNGNGFLMTIMPHTRSVDKGAFLLLREDVTSPMRTNCMVKLSPKITKIQEP